MNSYPVKVRGTPDPSTVAIKNLVRQAPQPLPAPDLPSSFDVRDTDFLASCLVDSAFTAKPLSDHLEVAGQARHAIWRPGSPKQALLCPYIDTCACILLREKDSRSWHMLHATPNSDWPVDEIIKSETPVRFDKAYVCNDNRGVKPALKMLKDADMRLADGVQVRDIGIFAPGRHEESRTSVFFAPGDEMLYAFNESHKHILTLQL